MIPAATRRSEFYAGLRDMVPLLVGAAPFGIIFGAVAVANGLSPWAGAAMSALVFAGSSQFLAAGLVAQGAGIGVIVLATLVINLRHALYAATLAPHMRHLPQRWLLPLGFILTDEAFVVAVRRYNEPDQSPWKHWYYAGAAIAMFVVWQLFTYLGLWAGQAIPDPLAWGLDFAFPVTFLGMLLPAVKGRPVVACVLVAGVAALLLQGLPNQLGLVTAAILGISAGVLAERAQPGAVAHRQQPETVR
jgi:4-azaleucine resistance transporter AzlC